MGDFPFPKNWNYNDFMSLEWIVPLLTGWLAGWVINYVSDVLPETRRLGHPACLQCNEPIPLREYLLFGKCPNGHVRHRRAWLVQFASVAMSIYSYFNPPIKIEYWAGLLLLIYFGIVIAIDVEHKLILHPTSIAGSILALMLGLVSHGLVDTLLGGLSGLLVMLAFYYFGVVFARLRARRMRAQGLEADDEEALGQGDVILVTILGLLVGGPTLTLVMIVLSILLGGLVSFFLIIGMMISRRYDENALMMFIPFGPYFVIGAGIIVYFPDILKSLLPS